MKRSVTLLACGLLLAGCSLFPAGPATLAPGVYQTAVAQTLTALAPTVPTATGTPASATASPTPVPASRTPLPSATSAPVQTPDQFIRAYYANINLANYPLTWSLLTDRFKSVMNGAGLGGYTGYVKFWNTVHEVRVQNVAVVSSSPGSATVRVTAVYHYNSGVLSTDSSLFVLAYDPARQTWLFDSSYANTPTPGATATRTPTRSATPSRTSTPVASVTASATATSTPSATPSPTSSETPSATPTETPVTPTETPTPTST
jgi:hypothetical protein